MADDHFTSFQPVDAEVRVLSIRPIEVASPASVETCRLDKWISAAQAPPIQPDPIKLRGVGSTTLFGLSSRFEDDFPSSLIGKLAVEEYQSTINRVNAILLKSVPFNLKFLLFGWLCCCCTLGLSFGPALYLNKRTRSRIEKLLESENWRLYNKVGLSLRLSCEETSTNLREHVLLIEFLPKTPLFQPD